MTKAKRRGPQNTLTDAPHMAEIRARLAKKGFGFLKDAAAESGMHYDTFVKTCRHGLPADPKQRILDGLEKLGILDLVQGVKRRTG